MKQIIILNFMPNNGNETVISPRSVALKMSPSKKVDAIERVLAFLLAYIVSKLANHLPKVCMQLTELSK